MSVIQFAEKADSRAITQTTSGEGQRLRFWAGYGLDEVAVMTAFRAQLPLSWDSLALQGIDLKPEGSSGMWDCTADYAFSAELLGAVLAGEDPGLLGELGPEFEFDLTAQSAHITQSLGTVASRLAAPAWAPATKYAVGQYVTAGLSVYRCSTAGTSAGAGAGPTGTGLAIADGSAKWDYSSTPPPAWMPGTAYAVGDKISGLSGLYVCSAAGVSLDPGGGPVGFGTGIADGTAAWDYEAPDTAPGAPDYHGAIGVTRSQVTGCDVYSGHLEFGVTRQVYPVTVSLLLALLMRVGTINDAPFYGCPPKSLLYLGCTGQCKPGDIWTLKHRFAASPTLTDIPVGPNIVVPLKAGWDFLWATYTDQQLGDFLVQVPYAAYVEQVYRLSDFSELPI